MLISLFDRFLSRRGEFDESVNLYSFVNLSANYSVGGQSVDINVQIDPVIDGNGVWNNLVLHAAIFEYTTFNNARSNGEFEFLSSTWGKKYENPQQECY